jgi:flagellar basal body-associated protein FliL
MNVILMYLLILIAITVSVYIYLMISKGELDVGDSNNNKLFVTYDPDSNNITTEPVSNVTNLISSNAGNITANKTAARNNANSIAANKTAASNNAKNFAKYTTTTAADSRYIMTSPAPGANPRYKIKFGSGYSNNNSNMWGGDAVGRYLFPAGDNAVKYDWGWTPQTHFVFEQVPLGSN